MSFNTSKKTKASKSKDWKESVVKSKDDSEEPEQSSNNNKQKRQLIEDMTVDLDRKFSEVTDIKELLIRVVQLGVEQSNPTARFDAINLIRKLEGRPHKPRFTRHRFTLQNPNYTTGRKYRDEETGSYKK